MESQVGPFKGLSEFNIFNLHCVLFQKQALSKGRACFNPDHSNEVKTRETCAEPGNFLGNQSRPVTVIDTPGFNDNL